MIFTFNTIILIVLLFLAVKYDIAEMKIPNFLTFPVILWGIGSSVIFSGLNGFLFSMSGFLVGMAVFFIPFAMGGIGAGDVKLFGAVGALMGWRFVILAAVVTALVGGLIAIGYYVVKDGFVESIRQLFGILFRPILYFIYLRTNSSHILNFYEYFKNVKSNTSKQYIPYGISIGIGTLVVLAGKYMGRLPF